MKAWGEEMIKRDGKMPVYREIMFVIAGKVIAGELKAGERIPSIRNLALEFKVNPNTVQRALLELEREDIIYTDRTNGKYVTEDEAVLKALKHEMTQHFVDDIISEAQVMGFDKQEVIELIRKNWKGDSE